MKSALGMLLFTVGLWMAAPASAQEDVAAFYRGKQLRLVVGTGAGGEMKIGLNNDCQKGQQRRVYH